MSAEGDLPFSREADSDHTPKRSDGVDRAVEEAAEKANARSDIHRFGASRYPKDRDMSARSCRARSAVVTVKTGG